MSNETSSKEKKSLKLYNHSVIWQRDPQRKMTSNMKIDLTVSKKQIDTGRADGICYESEFR